MVLGNKFNNRKYIRFCNFKWFEKTNLVDGLMIKCITYTTVSADRYGLQIIAQKTRKKKYPNVAKIDELEKKLENFKREIK